ncbi:MAG TPA: MauE/DoxX family redox-associated membrane protein [Desulfobaccales bacterium]|nr:MauE/DoxX family redox-associated membrane protein [Desulfobaccales bacterium]
MSRIGVKPTASQGIPVADNSGRSRPHPDPGGPVGLTWLHHFLRLGLACIFIYAGFIKLLDPLAFAHAIAQYDLIPEGLLPLVAVGLPALELLAGVGLIFEVRGSLTLMAFLLLIFLVILGYAVWHNLDIDCGCFPLDELDAQHGVKTAFWRDLIMIGATLFLYWRRRSRAPQRFPNIL